MVPVLHGLLRPRRMKSEFPSRNLLTRFKSVKMRKMGVSLPNSWLNKSVELAIKMENRIGELQHDHPKSKLLINFINLDVCNLVIALKRSSELH